MQIRSSIWENENRDGILSEITAEGPYYTSYPTLGLWDQNHGHGTYVEAMKDLFLGNGAKTPIELYIHIPFCAKLCWYCICNIKVSNNRQRIQQFVDYLLREIDLLESFFEQNSVDPNITEIHLGGGTPSHLDNKQMDQLVDKLSNIVDVKALDEFAMEIDPRTTTRENLHYYSSLGVSRISFGIQDFDARVQAAINRVQPPEMIDDLLPHNIRKEFDGINFDLLYGLPLQDRETFRNTVELVKKFHPERVTLLKYAHIPDIRKHMKMIEEEDLPSNDQLPLMFVDAVESFVDYDYEWIGIDNFAKKNDALGIAAQKRKVWRTFNGFTPGRTHNIIGLGPTTTVNFANYYFQSVYDLVDYRSAIDMGEFPIHRGYILSQDEVIRRSVIFEILCQQQVDFNHIDKIYQITSSDYFEYEIDCLKKEYLRDGKITFENNIMSLTTVGRFLIRGICRVFDKHHRNRDYKVLGP